MQGPEDAIEYFKALREILVSLGVNNGNMNEGNLRCDANISVRPLGTTTLRTRVELKNLNSFKFLKDAIDYEVARQIDIYQHCQCNDPSGKHHCIRQQTRLYDNQKGVTVMLRIKEEENEYRYFPDPDLLPLVVSEARVAEVRAHLPELPRAKAARLSKDHGVAPADAVVITGEPAMAAYFERCLTLYPDGKRLGNWFCGELSRVLNENLTTLETLAFTPEQLAALLKLVDAGTISFNSAKEVFAEMVAKGGEPSAIMTRLGLAQSSDSSAVEVAADKVIAANPGELERYRGGKKQLLGFFVGQVMREMKGKGNPAIVNKVVQQKLDA